MMKMDMKRKAKWWFISALVISDLYSPNSLVRIFFAIDNLGLKYLKKLCMIIHLKISTPIAFSSRSLLIKFKLDNLCL